MALIIGTKFNDILVGTSSDNTIFDMDGNDTIVAGAGNDTIFAGKGSDFISGGDGVDTVDFSGHTEPPYYFHHPDGVYVNLLHHAVAYDDPFHSEWGPEGTIVNVENVNGTNYVDTLIGDYNNNVLNGNGGDDTL